MDPSRVVRHLPVETITQICEELGTDHRALHTALSINRQWCRIAVPYLWKLPFFGKDFTPRKGQRIVATYLKALNAYEIEKLIGGGFTFTEVLEADVPNTFDYASYLKGLDFINLSRAVEHFIDHLHSQCDDDEFLLRINIDPKEVVRYERRRDLQKILNNHIEKEKKLVVTALWSMLSRSVESLEEFRLITQGNPFRQDYRLPETTPITASQPPFSRLQSLILCKCVPEGIFRLLAERCQRIHTLSVEFPGSEESSNDLANLIAKQQSLRSLFLYGSGGAMLRIANALRCQQNYLLQANFERAHLTRALLTTLSSMSHLKSLAFSKCRNCLIPTQNLIFEEDSWVSLEKLIVLDTDLDDQHLKKIIERARKTLRGLWITQYNNGGGVQAGPQIYDYAKQLRPDLCTDPDARPELPVME